MTEKPQNTWYGWLMLAAIIGRIIYKVWPEPPRAIETPARMQAQEAQPTDRKIQLLRPQWGNSGRDGVEILSGFDEAGHRIVATTATVLALLEHQTQSLTTGIQGT
jgi:hypothetical protein